MAAAVPAEMKRPWLGPLSLASPDLVGRLQAAPSFATLMARGWEPDRTLVSVPPKKEGYDLEIFVVGRMFSWDDRSPVVWMFSTIGLSALEQPAGSGRTAFRRFELVLATNNAQSEDPFPTRIGIVMGQPPGSFPGWDWDQVRYPPLLNWLEIAAQEIGSMIRTGSHFALADTLTIGPGNAPWTRSVLDHSVLLPVPPHMLASGFGPFNTPSDPPDTVKPAEWHRHPGTDRFENGFAWMLPVSEQEHARANSGGTWNLFADLVELAPSDAHDDCSVAFDLLRGAGGRQHG